MNAVLSFDWLAKGLREAPARNTVFFFRKSALNFDDVHGAIDAYYSNAPISDAVIFICPGSEAHNLRKLLSDSRISQRLRIAHFDDKLPQPRLMTIQANGIISEHTGSDYFSVSPIDNDTYNEIRQWGAQSVFKRYGAMLEASSYHHYVKPSLKHTDRFIRTGNVLISSAEIDFLALWLLPFLKSGTKFIYTDSSTINSVAVSAVLLHNRLSDISGHQYPEIQSFESYKNLDKFDFISRDEALFLISASTGGGMLKDLVRKHRVGSDRLCTIFYLGKEKPLGKVICNLTKDEHNGDGYAPAVVTKSGDRGTFAASSFPVHIQSEAFVPENPVVEAIQVTQDDIPKWWESFKKSFLGIRAITCNSIDSANIDQSSPPRRAAQLLVHRALRIECPFQKKFDQIVRLFLPATLRIVIYFEDEGSRAMKSRLKLESGKKGVQFVRARDYTRSNGEKYDVSEADSGSTLVLCSVLSNTARLLDVAQVLRIRQKNHAISFIFGISACSSENDFKEIRSNLIYSQSGVPYGFHFVEKIELARSFRDEATPWQEELSFWTSKRGEKTILSNRRLRETVEQRIGILRSCSQEGAGHMDSLFFLATKQKNSKTRIDLALRPNSVFTRDLCRGSDFSQSDVFFAAASVLHNMRCRQVGRARLVQYPHKRSVISPTLFFRFSDGVIQAAFLRASKNTEFDYRMDKDLSKLAADVLIGIFQWPRTQRAEALAEVLYAILTEKILLLKKDIGALVNILEPRLMASSDVLERYFCAEIRRLLLA